MLKDILKLKGVVVMDDSQKKSITGGGSEEFLDCEITQIDVTDDGGFLTHETCCSKAINGQGGGTCFEVTWSS